LQEGSEYIPIVCTNCRRGVSIHLEWEPNTGGKRAYTSESTLIGPPVIVFGVFEVFGVLKPLPLFSFEIFAVFPGGVPF
jgi:hypothetical protein